ncbi:MAG: homoserine kinase [Moorellales bacterium]
MIRVCVPASTANLGPGFDSVGMALSLYNYLEVEEGKEPGLRLEIEGEGKDFLPCHQGNLVARVMLDFFRQVGCRPGGLHLRLQNNIPIGKGLGSSAAAVAGALVAANYLAGSPLGKPELLELGTRWEGHPDNVAAALYGGLVVAVRSEEGVVCRRLDPPSRLQVVVAVPDFSLPTSQSRRVLPSAVAVEDAVFNLGRVGLLLLAFLEGDLELLRVATEDRLHQPYRARLIPGLAEVFRAAREAGALGVTLSGAGPAVIALVTNGAVGVGQAMRGAFQAHNIGSQVWILAPAREGAQVATFQEEAEPGDPPAGEAGAPEREQNQN